ncbi:MAG: dihydroorotase [Clostridia bacterium]|nr:dihydroorotase [Clostridia bacterium]
MILKNGLILIGGELVSRDIALDSDGVIVAIGENLSGTEYVDLSGLWVMPSAVDVHVHLREPGYDYKETVASGTLAAAKGGVGIIMPMPNLNPCPDSVANLKVQQDIIDRDAVVKCYPFASVTKGEMGAELSDLTELAPIVKAFTDDGKGVNNLELLRKAMEIAKQNGIVIASHAEAENLGTTPEAEIVAVGREIEMAKEVGVKYHFCHISTAKAYEYIRKAKAEGYDITVEACPHHLLLCDRDIKDGNTKMNPPLRSREDMLATVEALLDGTVDMLATDHAPHAKHEKGEYSKSLNGIIGLETFLPSIYTHFVMNGQISHERFVELVSTAPAKRFGLPVPELKVGAKANLCALDIASAHTYTESEIVSLSTNSPFIGYTFYGFNKLTMVDGKVVWQNL